MNKLIPAFGALLLMTACASKTSSDNESGKVDKIEEQKIEMQSLPIESGLYDASSYDITGSNPRKGKFDGRIYFTLSPDLSAFYVYENGNRTKIDYLVTLKQPFEKTDSCYMALDKNDMPVKLCADSATYFISFHKSGADISIGFDPEPRHTCTAVQALEKINELKSKNK